MLYEVITEQSKITDFPSTLFFVMIEDKKGNIWVGGHNGIMRFDYHPNEDIIYQETELDLRGLEDIILKGLFSYNFV